MDRLYATDTGVAAKAASVLRAGGIVLYPTDTLYGLGADALSDEALAGIIALKGRDAAKPIHAIVSDLAMAEQYGDIHTLVRMLARELPKGKATFIVRKRAGLETGILRGKSTFGFRIPDSALCAALLRSFGGPITATSANASGEAPPSSVDGILAQLGERAASIACVIDAGELPPSSPSTVIDLSAAEPVILREGAVPDADVWNAIRAEY